MYFIQQGHWILWKMWHNPKPSTVACVWIICFDSSLCGVYGELLLQCSKQCIFVRMKHYCIHVSSNVSFPTGFLVLGDLEILNQLRVLSSRGPQQVSPCPRVELAKHFCAQPLVAVVAINESFDSRCHQICDLHLVQDSRLAQGRGWQHWNSLAKISILYLEHSSDWSIKCEGVGVVKRVHTLSGGVHRLATALKEVEEVRDEVQEIKRWMGRWGSRREWRIQGPRGTLTTCVDDMTCATPLSHAVQCESWRHEPD